MSHSAFECPGCDHRVWVRFPGRAQVPIVQCGTCEGSPKMEMVENV